MTPIGDGKKVKHDINKNNKEGVIDFDHLCSFFVS